MIEFDRDGNHICLGERGVWVIFEGADRYFSLADGGGRGSYLVDPEDYGRDPEVDGAGFDNKETPYCLELAGDRSPRPTERSPFLDYLDEMMEPLRR